MGKNLRLWGADGGAPSIWLIVCEITYFVPLGLAELQRSLSVSPWKTENTNIYTRVCICSPMSRACVFRFCQTTPKLQLWAIHLNADSTACFFWGGACVYDSLHQNTRLSVLMTIAVFQYLETFPFSFLSVIPSVISLLCYVCSFSSIVNFLFLWTNKEPYEVAKYNTVFSSFTYLFFLYQRLRLEKDFSVFEDSSFC